MGLCASNETIHVKICKNIYYLIYINYCCYYSCYVINFHLYKTVLILYNKNYVHYYSVFVAVTCSNQVFLYKKLSHFKLSVIP